MLQSTTNNMKTINFLFKPKHSTFKILMLLFILLAVTLTNNSYWFLLIIPGSVLEGVVTATYKLK